MAITLVAGAMPNFVAIEDIDGDGSDDIVVTSAVPDTVSVFRQDPAFPGTFLSPLDFPVGRPSVISMQTAVQTWLQRTSLSVAHRPIPAMSP